MTSVGDTSGESSGAGGVDILTGKIVVSYVAGKDLISKDLKESAKLLAKMKAEAHGWTKALEGAKQSHILGTPKDFTTLRQNLQYAKNQLHDLDKAAKNARAGKYTADSWRKARASIKYELEAIDKDMAKHLYRRIQSNQLKNYSASLRDIGKNAQWAGRQLTVGLTLPLAVFAQKSVHEFTAVNKQLVRLQKLAGLRLTNDQDAATMKQLTSEARVIGEAFGKNLKITAALFGDLAAQGASATAETKLAAEQLDYLGYKGKKASKGISEIGLAVNEIERLATLGDIDVKPAQELFRVIRTSLGTTQNFAESIRKTHDEINVMNFMEQKTSIFLEQLSSSFPKTAGAAKEFGLSVAETSAILAGMYQSMPDAEGNANALKVTLVRLIDPTKKAADEFDKALGKQGVLGNLKNIGNSKQGMLRLTKFFDETAKAAEKAAGPTGNVQIEMLRLLSLVTQPRQASRMVDLYNRMTDVRGETVSAVDALKMYGEVADKVLSGIDQNASDTGAAFSKSFDAATANMNDFTRSMIIAEIHKRQKFDKYFNENAKFQIELVLASPEKKLQMLKAKFSNAMAEIGAKLYAPMSKVFNIIVSIIDKFNKLPDPFKNLIISSLGLVAALGPLTMGFAYFAQITAKALRPAAALIGIFSKMKNITPAMIDAAGGVGALEKKGIEVVSHSGATYAAKGKTFGGMRSLRKMMKGVRPETGELVAEREVLDAEKIASMKTIEHHLAEIARLEKMVGTAAAEGAAEEIAAHKASIASMATHEEKVAASLAETGPKTGIGGYSIPGLSGYKSKEEATSHFEELHSAEKFKKYESESSFSGYRIAGKGAKKEAVAEAVKKDIEKETEIITAARAASAAKIAEEEALAAEKIAKSKTIKGLLTPRGDKSLFTFPGKNKIKEFFGSIEGESSKASKKIKALVEGLGNIGGKLKSLAMKSPLGKVAKGFKAGFETMGGAVKEGFKGASLTEGIGVKTIGKGLLSGGGKMLAGIAGGGLEAGIAIGGLATSLAALAVPIILIVGLIIGLKKHWKEVSEGFKKSGFLKSLSKAWKELGKVFSEIGSIFTNTIGKKMGKGAGKETQTFWQKLGYYAGQASKIVVVAVKAIGAILKFLKPAFKMLASMIADVVDFIRGIFSGDWETIWKSALLIVYDYFASKFVLIFDYIRKPIFKFFDIVLGIGQKVAHFFKLDGVAGTIESVRNSLNELNKVGIDQSIRNLLATSDDATAEHATESGKTVGRSYKQGLIGVIEQPAEVTPEIEANVQSAKDFIQSFHSAIQEQISKLTDQAKSAFDEYQNKILSVFDGQIKAIEELNKKDQERYDKEQYLEQRRELLRQRGLDHQSYIRARAKALYEGNIDEVRNLDEQEMQSKLKSNKDLANLDKERQKALTNKQREQETAKINKAKEAAQKRLEIQKKEFEDQLATITKYAPKNVEEYQNMINQINQLFTNFGQDPIFKNVAKLTVNSLKTAAQDAMKSLTDSKFWSAEGEAAGYQWMNAFNSQIDFSKLGGPGEGKKVGEVGGVTQFLGDKLQWIGKTELDTTNPGTPMDKRDKLAGNADVKKYFTTFNGSKTLEEQKKQSAVNYVATWWDQFSQMATQHAWSFNKRGQDVYDKILGFSRKGTKSSPEELSWLLDHNLIRFKVVNGTDLSVDGSYTAKLLSSLFPGGNIPKHHSGGWIKYHNGGNVLKSDESAAILQKGEFVVRKNVAQKMGPMLEAMNRGSFGGMSSGGGIKGVWKTYHKDVENDFDQHYKNIGVKTKNGIKATAEILVKDGAKFNRINKTVFGKIYENVDGVWKKISKCTTDTWKNISSSTNQSISSMSDDINSGSDKWTKGFGKTAKSYAVIGNKIQTYNFLLQTMLNEFSHGIGAEDIFKPRMRPFDIPTYHQGGIVGQNNNKTRIRGKIGKDEQFALLKKGERVLTQKESLEYGDGYGFNGSNVLNTLPRIQQLFLAAIRKHESGGNYSAVNRAAGRAAGAYQFLTSTWNNWEGYKTADIAPNASQDRKAIAYLSSLRRIAESSRIWALGWFGGPSLARRGLKGKVPGGPGGANGSLTWEGFAKTIQVMMREIAGGPVGGVTRFSQRIPELLGMALGSLKGKAKNIVGKTAFFESLKALAYINAMTGLGGIAGAGGTIGGADKNGWTEQALVDYMRSTGVPFRAVSMFRPGAKTHATGRTSYHAVHRAVDFAGIKPGSDTPELLNIFNAFRPIENKLKELIYSGASYYVINGQRRPIDKLNRITFADHHNHVHAAMKNGGFVKATPGGITATLGEGGKNEAVIPLPRFNLDEILRSFVGPTGRAALYKDLAAISSSGGMRSEQIHTTNIYVDNFIGEEKWFNELMSKYEVNVKRVDQRSNGIMNRRVTSIKDNYVRY